MCISLVGRRRPDSGLAGRSHMTHGSQPPSRVSLESQTEGISKVVVNSGTFSSVPSTLPGPRS